jgi:hypothetical protein
MAAEVPSQAPQTYGFPLYPELPQSGSDLIPLPQRVNGPKLKPFDFQGSQQIEFLDYLGEGLHSHVIKVKILGQIYALKLVRPIWKSNWWATSTLLTTLYLLSSCSHQRWTGVAPHSLLSTTKATA